MIRMNLVSNAPNPFEPVAKVYTGPSLFERASKQMLNASLFLVGAYFVCAILYRIATG